MSIELDRRSGSGKYGDGASPTTLAPGRSTLTSRIQRRAASAVAASEPTPPPVPTPAPLPPGPEANEPYIDAFGVHLLDRSQRMHAGAAACAPPSTVDPSKEDSPPDGLPIQARADGALVLDAEQVHAQAAAGVQGAGGPMPHATQIKKSFGAHAPVVDGIRAHVGGAAADATAAIGAVAYATGNAVAFRSSPDVFTAAHEAAHVVQQQAGVQLLGGVGEVGDAYERNADEVAAKVVAGDSAEELLGGSPARHGTTGVQRRPADPDSAASASGDARSPRPRALVPLPTRVEFSAAGSGDDVERVRLRNTGREVVWLVDAYIVGGGRAFSVLVNEDLVVTPGGEAEVAIKYTPDRDNGEEATLLVIDSDGTATEVQIAGPPAAERVSKRSGGIETFPLRLEFDDFLLRGQGAEFAVFRKIALINRTGAAIPVGAIESGTNEAAFRLSSELRELAPGRTLEVSIEFLPRITGEHSATMYLMDRPGGDVYGSFLVTGHAIAAPAQPDRPDATSSPQPELVKPDLALCEPLTPETETQRRIAQTDVQNWKRATVHATQASFSELRQQWIRYLALTSANPTVSEASLPDSSVIHGFLSNAFGNAISDHALDVEARIAPSVATAVLGTAALTGGVGFVLGALVETLAGLLFDALFPGDSVDDAVREAHAEGFAAGAEVTGAEIAAKVGELDKAHADANAEIEREEARFVTQVDGSCSTEELTQVSSVLRRMRNESTQLKKPSPALLSGLLALWARDHAASTTRGGKGLEKQWQGVTAALSEGDKGDNRHFTKDSIKNQPDLFVAQCRAEWGQHGLAVPEALQASILAEGASAAPSTAQEAQPFVLALRFMERFNGREFVWHGLQRADLFQKDLRSDSEHPVHGEQAMVTCTLRLGVENQSCVVHRFEYRLALSGAPGGRDQRAYALPGEPEWHYVDENHYHDGYPDLKWSPPPEHVRAYQIFDVITEIRNAGHDVVQESDAADNPALQAEFGEQVAIPRTQHADGRREPVSVFRVTCQGDGKLRIPDGTVELLRRGERRNQSRMVRGGNVILVVESCSLDR